MLALMDLLLLWLQLLLFLSSRLRIKESATDFVEYFNESEADERLRWIVVFDDR